MLSGPPASGKATGRGLGSVCVGVLPAPDKVPAECEGPLWPCLHAQSHRPPATRQVGTNEELRFPRIQFCECFCVPLPGSGVLLLPTSAPEEDTPGSGSCFSKCQGSRDTPPPHLVHDKNVRPSSLASLSGHLRCGTDPEVTFLGLGLKLCLAPPSLHAPPGSTSRVITPICSLAQYSRVFVQGAWLGGNLMR